MRHSCLWRKALSFKAGLFQYLVRARATPWLARAFISSYFSQLLTVILQCGEYMGKFSEERGRVSQSGMPREQGRNGNQGRQRRSARPEAGAALKDAVAEIDRDILRLLLRRYNLLEKMRGVRAALDPAEEKFLREAWQKSVARVSRDADLSGRFFALMQGATFLPRTSRQESDAKDADPGIQVSAPKGAERREAFNLAPPQKPVELSLKAPLDSRVVRAMLFWAAASGEYLKLSPCLMNDPQLDLLKALNQLGASATREQDAVLCRQAQPLGRPDKVIYVGESLWNLLLLIAFYLAKPSRIKFLGETELKLADLSSLRHFLPQLGARFTNVIPRSTGLPARLECSGMMPERADLPADVPAEFGAALLLCAPFFEREFTLGLGAHPHADEILAFAVPLLKSARISVLESKKSISVQPGKPQFADESLLPMDMELAAFLLALVMPLGGEVRLSGVWPHTPEADAAWEVLQVMGLPLMQINDDCAAIGAKLKAPQCARQLSIVPQSLLARLPDRLTPLPLALAACAALTGANTDVPFSALSALRCDPAQAVDFFAAAGLELMEEKLHLRPELERQSSKAFGLPSWNAPSPAWALGLALAACARPVHCGGFKLGNPGILTQLYPGFWALYNGLPRPSERQRNPLQSASPEHSHRRIRTEMAAVLPPEQGTE